MHRTALLLVDIQNDFLPSGSLAVRGADQILPTVNALLKHPFDLIVATKDWHPENHLSFASQHQKNVGEVVELGGHPQILWPDHCIQNTLGAAHPPALSQTSIEHTIYKGTDRTIDSYSAFFDNEKKRCTGLYDYLTHRAINQLVVVGIATDYCVKYTVLDALELGFKVVVIKEGCKGVNLQPQDEQKALESMENQGATVLLLKDFFNKFLVLPAT